MDRGDGRLELVGPDRRSPQGPLDQRGPLSDLGTIPERPILRRERHELAARPGPGRAACVGEEHQGEQARGLAVVGQCGVELARQPDRLVGEAHADQGQTRARRVALVEHEVEHLQDGHRPRGSVGRRRQLEGGAARADRRLGPADPLGDGGLGDEQRPGDLRRREAAHRAQRQRHLRRAGQGRVAAQVEEREAVVAIGGGVEDGDPVGRRAGGPWPGDGRLLAPPTRGVAPPLLDQAARGDGRQPAARVVRDPVAWPLRGRGDERLLDGVLAGIELAVTADQRGEDQRREITQQCLDRRPDVGGSLDVPGHISIPA